MHAPNHHQCWMPDKSWSVIMRPHWRLVMMDSPPLCQPCQHWSAARPWLPARKCHPPMPAATLHGMDHNGDGMASRARTPLQHAIPSAEHKLCRHVPLLNMRALKSSGVLVAEMPAGADVLSNTAVHKKRLQGLLQCTQTH